MVITFHFSDNDYCNYLVEINNKTYNISQDDCKIILKESCTKLNITLSYEQSNISFVRVIGTFFLELIKIPFFIIFEATSNDKWYENTPLYNFSYTFNIMTENKDSIDIYLQNSFFNSNTCSYTFPNISSESEIEFSNKTINNRFSDLQMDLLKYCFKVFWLVFPLEIILILAIKSSVIIGVFIVVFLLLMILLIGKAICKYKNIKSILAK